MTYIFQLLPPYKQFDKINIIHIHYQRKKIILWIDFYSQPYSFHIEYRRDEDDTQLICVKNKTEISLKDQNFVKVFCEDLKLLLMKDQKFEELKIDFENIDELGRKLKLEWIEDSIFDCFEESLKNRNEKIRFDTIRMDFSSDIIKFSAFDYIDPGTLTGVKIKGANQKIPEFLELKIWRETSNCVLEFDLDYLNEAISKAIWELFFTFSSPDIIHIYYKSIDIDAMNNFFETTFSSESIGNYCPKFVRLPGNDNYYLRILIATMGYVVFSKRIILELEPNFDLIEQSLSLQHIEELSKKQWELLNRNKKKENNILSTTENGFPNPTNTKTQSSEDEEKNWLKVFANPILMKVILHFAQGFGIQRLRKVCYSVRSCIDHLTPDPQIKSIWFDMDETDCIEIQLTLYNNHVARVFYEQIDEKTVKINRKFLTQGQLYTVFFDDLKRHFKNQGQILEEIRVDYLQEDSKNDNFLKFIENFKLFLESFSPFLKVKRLNMDALTQNNLMDILQYLDSECLKILEIRNTVDELQNNLEINEISNLKIWKNIKNLTVANPISTPIQEIDFSHFRFLNILVATVSSMDIFFLKNKLLEPSNFEKFKITFKTCHIDGSLYQLMDRLYHITPQKSVWYYRIPNTEFALHLVYNFNQSAIFTRVPLESVPDDAFRNRD